MTEQALAKVKSVICRFMASNPPKAFKFCLINWVFPGHTFWLVTHGGGISCPAMICGGGFRGYELVQVIDITARPEIEYRYGKESKFNAKGGN